MFTLIRIFVNMHPHVVYMFTYENFVAIIVLFYPKNKKMSTAVCDGWSKDSLLVILHDFDAICRLVNV